jgi:y4mF family transcriptional regulator
MEEKIISLSEFVRQKRKSLRMTQKEMSEKSGVGIRFIRELERGKETLKMDKVNQVLDLFGYELGPVESAKVNRSNEES